MLLIVLGWPPIAPVDRAEAAPAGSAAAAVTAGQEAYDAAVVDLLTVERRLDSAQQRLEEAQERAATIEADLAAARDLESRAAADLAGLEAQRSDRLRATYKNRSGGWLEVLFESDDLTQLLGRMFLLRRIVDQEGDLARQVAAAQVTAKEAAVRLEASRHEQKATVAELTAREAELRQARAQQKGLTARLGVRLAEAQAAAAAARRRMEELNRQAASTSADGGPAPEGAAGGGSDGDAAGGTSGGGSSGISDNGGNGGGSTGSGGATAGGRPAGRQLTVKATAYALPGTTATGVGVRHGIVAVDPRVIPLGTRLWIPGYGEGLAADTGGAIKGNWIDVWLPSERQALDWGVKTVTITILD